MPAQPVVGLLSPGDMGHNVAIVLRHHGVEVITNLQGRSPRTRALSKKADIVDVGSDEALVAGADIILSILVPSEAETTAKRLAPAIKVSGRSPIVVDCNAVAPATGRSIARIIEASGGRFVDAGIIGPPPRPGSSSTRFYASGEAVDDFARLRDVGINVCVVSQRVGDASAVKMCYAALTKGLTALSSELSIAAQALGVGDALGAELRLSQRAMLERMQGAIPAMVPKAHRWIGEMEEIAKTFADVGLTPKIHQGAADMFRLVAASELARTTPEVWKAAPPTYRDVVASLVDDLAGKQSD